MQTKKRGSLMVPIMIILVFITTALAMVMSIRKSNLLQYHILEDTYRMDIMLEISCLELHNALSKEQIGEEAIYQIPTQIVFPQGEVLITCEEKTKVKDIHNIKNQKTERHFYRECLLVAQLANGRTKQIIYDIELVPSEKVEYEYQIIE